MGSNITDEDLARIREVCAAATKGPLCVGWPKDNHADPNQLRWVNVAASLESDNPKDWITVVAGSKDDWGIPQGFLKPEDAQMYAAAADPRTGYAALAEELSRTREHLAELDKLLLPELNLNVEHLRSLDYSGLPNALTDYGVMRRRWRTEHGE